MPEPVRVFAQLLVVAMLLIGGSQQALAASAGPDPSASSQANEALKLGHRALLLYESGDYRTALELFSQADKAMHSPVFVLYAARSAARLDLLSQALVLFERCAAEELSEHSPPTWSNAIQSAQLAYRTLVQIVPQVTVHIRGDAMYPVEVRMVSDEQRHLLSTDKQLENESSQLQVLVTESAPAATTRVNEGAYQVTAKDASGAEIVLPFNARARSNVHLELVFRRTPLSPQAAFLREPIPKAPAQSKNLLRWGAYVAFGSGGALTLTSFIAGGLALNLAQKVRAQCDDGICPNSERARAQRSLSYARFSTAMFVSGMVGLTAGVTLSIAEYKRAKQQAQLGLRLEPGGVSVLGSF